LVIAQLNYRIGATSVILIFAIIIVFIFFGVQLLCIETKGKDIQEVEEEYKNLNYWSMLVKWK